MNKVSYEVSVILLSQKHVDLNQLKIYFKSLHMYNIPVFFGGGGWFSIYAIYHPITLIFTSEKLFKIHGSFMLKDYIPV